MSPLSPGLPGSPEVSQSLASLNSTISKRNQSIVRTWRTPVSTLPLGAHSPLAVGADAEEGDLVDGGGHGGVEQHVTDQVAVDGQLGRVGGAQHAVVVLTPGGRCGG